MELHTPAEEPSARWPVKPFDMRISELICGETREPPPPTFPAARLRSGDERRSDADTASALGFITETPLLVEKSRPCAALGIGGEATASRVGSARGGAALPRSRMGSAMANEAAGCSRCRAATRGPRHQADAEVLGERYELLSVLGKGALVVSRRRIPSRGAPPPYRLRGAAAPATPRFLR